MSLHNAERNLLKLGKDLGLELAFDEYHTCILGIGEKQKEGSDDRFSLHITYEANSRKLYVYCPILDGLPKNDQIKLKLYEALLEGSMLGGQMAGGGIGVAPQEELILMHSVLEMEHAQEDALRFFCPIFVETVEKWRTKAKAICEGRPHEDDKTARPPINPLNPSQGEKGKFNMKV